MDSATNWVQSHASTAAITLGVLVVLVIILLITTIVYARRAAADHMSILRYNNFRGGNSPLWYLGAEHAGLGGSIERKIRFPIGDANMEHLDRGYPYVVPEGQFHDAFQDNFNGGMPWSPGCGVRSEAHMEAQGQGLLGAIDLYNGTPAASMAMGYHDPNHALPAETVRELINDYGGF